MLCRPLRAHLKPTAQCKNDKEMKRIKRKRERKSKCKNGGKKWVVGVWGVGGGRGTSSSVASLHYFIQFSVRVESSD